ncbi:Rrp15p-domain-containing protein [Pseudovirgaria hyperparasitica]|uniref:Rrp15p-domain-containing protein n=1 Tax=Pseudovirgaria hyperparasitica TaxID=470096 RepID=A0A6A6VW29_9PEZI|nr:Rrp15p-domain-containing protein [Pseudovirgaria hyperparasitica]KAF2754792.1 Rrp15p-domain-containing protein [Pseudovirgaria hyperparasitica]
MPSKVQKRPRPGESMRGQPKKKIRVSQKQISKERRAYHSSSEEESGADQSEQELDVEVSETVPQDGSDNEARDGFDAEDLEAANASEESEADSEGSETSTTFNKSKKKRQDPEVFANSISRILSSKLSTSKRADPVLSRSKDAATAIKEMAEGKLEAKAKNKMREDKRAALEKGRVKDVLALDNADESTARVVEEEKKLKKMAQRGVVKLFNAVRAAQVKGEEAVREARKANVVGMDKRDEMASEMSKKSFLDLISKGGKKLSTSKA